MKIPSIITKVVLPSPLKYPNWQKYMLISKKAGLNLFFTDIDKIKKSMLEELEQPKTKRKKIGE